MSDTRKTDANGEVTYASDDVTSSDGDVRRASVDDVRSLAELSDTVFRPNQAAGTSMGVEFAAMFSEANAHNLYFVEEDGKPVSLVGTMPARVSIFGVSVGVLSIGSVCTLPEYRNRHYASKMLAQILKDFTSTTSLMLVSGGLSIYRRIGCIDFGDWQEAVFSNSVDSGTGAAPSGPDGSYGVEITRGIPAVSEMHALHRLEPLRYSRSLGDMECLVSTMSAPQFRAQAGTPEAFAAYRQGTLVAYLLALKNPNRHSDTVDVFEWAGDRTVLPELTAAAREYFQAQGVRLAAHGSDKVLQSVLSASGARLTSMKNQGTLRVLSPGLLLQEIGPLLQEMHGAHLELLEVDKEVWQVHWEGSHASNLPGEGLKLNGIAELSTWLFDPSGLNLPLPRTDDLNYI